MNETKITLSALWIMLMLTFLLGDVLRIFSGDFKPGEMGGQPFHPTQAMWLGISVLMLTPIVMIFFTLKLDQPVNRWVNIIMAVLWFGFNLIGLPTYPSLYDRFLIVVGLVWNVLTIWYAWNWV